MSTTHPELENSIQLALEAATAANDAAEDSHKTASDTHAAAERLDRFARTMRPLMIGLVGGVVLCLLLGGLIYLRTLSDLRAAHETQMEALALFTTSVGELKSRVDALEGIEELNQRLAEMASGQADGFAGLQSRIADMGAGSALPDVPGEDELVGPLPQMMRSLSQTVTDNHATTRESFAAGLSDLQLALTRMLAQTPPAPVAAPKPKPAARAPAPAPTRAPARPRPEPNPFSYP